MGIIGCAVTESHSKTDRLTLGVWLSDASGYGGGLNFGWAAAAKAICPGIGVVVGIEPTTSNDVHLRLEAGGLVDRGSSDERGRAAGELTYRIVHRLVDESPVGQKCRGRWSDHDSCYVSEGRGGPSGR